MTAFIIYLYLVGCLSQYFTLCMAKPDDSRMNIGGPIVVALWFIVVPIVAVAAIVFGFRAKDVGAE